MVRFLERSGGLPRLARLLGLSSTLAAPDGKVREGKTSGRRRAPGGRSGLVAFPVVGDEGPCEKVGGAVQSGGRVGKAALLRLCPCPAPGGAVSCVPLPSDLPATFPRGWARGLGGRVCSAHPHPTARAFGRGSGHGGLPPSRGPYGADPQVASCGLCGVTAGGFPPRGCVPAHSLPPLEGGSWSGLPRPVVGRPLLWACRAVARRLPTPSEPRGFLPTPPAAVLSGSLALSPLSCPWSCLVLSPSHLCRVPASVAPRFP